MIAIRDEVGPSAEAPPDDLTLRVVEEVVEVEIERYRLEVTRVPVGRIVDEMPLARAEGDTTFVPVVEERLVVVRQLFLKEELRVRHIVEREVARETVPLRRQKVVEQRFDPSKASMPLDDLGGNPSRSEPSR